MMTKSIVFNLGLAALLIGAAAGLAYAARLGLIDGELPVRGTMALVGIILAFFANFVPKFVSRRPAKVQRVAGWAFALSGLAYAAIWAFAPLDSAAVMSMAPVGTALVAVVVYCAWARAKSA